MIEELIGTERVSGYESAGDPREGQKVELIVVVDDRRSGHELAETSRSAAQQRKAVPNYFIDQDGSVRLFVDEKRAGNGLELAVYKQRRRNIDRAAVSIALQRRAGEGYSDAQINALHGLIPGLLERYGLDEDALSTLLTDPDGRLRVYTYLPPPPPVESTDDLLGAAPLEAPQRQWLWLYGESWNKRGGQPKLNTAFAYYAAKFGLGAPMAPNAPPAVTHAGKTYNIQVFARDVIFNEGNDWTGIQSYRALLDNSVGPDDKALALFQGGFDASIKTSEGLLGAPFTHTKTFRPDWRFHVVVANSSLGPAISDNYVLSADQQYAFQVFAGDTLYTPMNEQNGFFQLSLTEPSHPAYQKLWEETYKYARVAYDPNSPFQQRAVQDKLGTPLSGLYEGDFEGTHYKLQVFALDTLYAGPDGQIKRMSELPKTPEIEAWNPTPPKVMPPAPPEPVRPPAAPATIGKAAPVPNDPNWPPMPNFGILTDSKGARERMLGRIEWRRQPTRQEPRSIAVLNGWVNENIVAVDVPQLRKFVGNNKIQFHRAAAEAFRRFWEEVERQGYLPLVLTWAGTWVPRVMTSDYSRLSNHAYGTAFDINVTWNGWQKRAALVGQKGSVRELVPIANACGFFWGGHWPIKWGDGMHFEWAGTR